MENVCSLIDESKAEISGKLDVWRKEVESVLENLEIDIANKRKHVKENAGPIKRWWDDLILPTRNTFRKELEDDISKLNNLSRIRDCLWSASNFLGGARYRACLERLQEIRKNGIPDLAIYRDYLSIDLEMLDRFIEHIGNLQQQHHVFG